MDDSNITIENDANTSETRICYIAAPLNTDLKALEKLLAERQIQPIVSADLSSEATTLLGGIVNAIATADLFVAMLNEEQNNATIYLELGIALGIGCRILIIAPPDRPLMVDIAELPAVQADITNDDAISSMLDQVLLSPPRQFRPQLPMPTIQKGQPLGDFADELLAEFNALGERGREVEIVQLVKKALKKSVFSTTGVNPLLALEHDTRADRADIVVWSDEFGPWIGSPLIIEVKRVVRTMDWKNVVNRVFSYLQLSHTRSALIVYAKAEGALDVSPSVVPPNIFFLDIHQLLFTLRTKSFAQIMIDLRNRRVHGMDTL